MRQGVKKSDAVQPTSFSSLCEVSELDFQIHYSAVDLTERFNASRTYFLSCSDADENSEEQLFPWDFCPEVAEISSKQSGL